MTPNDDYTLLVEFEGDNKIIFNMRDLIATMPTKALAIKPFQGHHAGGRGHSLARPHTGHAVPRAADRVRHAVAKRE